LGFASPDLPEGGGRVVVDISSTLELKFQAIRAYQSQFPAGKERVFRMVEGLARTWGAGAGFEAGEVLITAGMLGVSDLMQVVCP